MEKKGILAVVSGFSGAGKGTLMKGLLSAHPEYALSISATTRSPRVNRHTGEKEVEGIDYFFISKDEFENMIDRDELLEYAEYQGNYYGTPRSYVEEMLSQGRNVILEIDVQGACKVKAKMPDTVMLFVVPPSADELAKRLRSRGTETEEQIKGRLRRATNEAEFIPSYDYVLINDDLAASIERLHNILVSEHARTIRSEAFVNELTSQLKDIMKGEEIL